MNISTLLWKIQVMKYMGGWGEVYTVHSIFEVETISAQHCEEDYQNNNMLTS